LELSLEEETLLKKNKEEYDSMAEHILRLPSREQLEKYDKSFITFYQYRIGFVVR